MLNISGLKIERDGIPRGLLVSLFEPWSKKTVDFHVEGFSNCQLFCSTNQEKK